jgi:ABC-2 type transport system ATP-binding protein
MSEKAPETVIEAKGLAKHYGKTAAVDHIDLEIRAGETFGLLGPNGSGKTTTILMLLGLTEPTAGSVRVLGHDPLRQPLEVKRHVGYLPDAVGFYDHLTARENLAFAARLAGVDRTLADDRIAQALERVRLSDVGDRNVATFSRGMRQRLGLADILIKECRVAILDEPTSGLDPQSTHELLAMIRKLADEGMTVILSSHLLGMVQSVCDRVALFNRGRIGLVGRVGDLAREVLGGSHVIEVEADNIDLGQSLDDIEGVTRVHANGSGAATVDAARDVRPEVARRVVERGGTLRSLTAGRTSLDEVYIRYFDEVSHAA